MDDLRDLRVYPRVFEFGDPPVGMVVVYDPVGAPDRYAMRPGALATIVRQAPHHTHDPGFWEIEFIQPRRPTALPRNGQADGAYHMRDFRVVLRTVPKFTTTDQAQAWLDQHTTPFPLGA